VSSTRLPAARPQDRLRPCISTPFGVLCDNNSFDSGKSRHLFTIQRRLASWTDATAKNVARVDLGAIILAIDGLSAECGVMHTHTSSHCQSRFIGIAGRAVVLRWKPSAQTLIFVTEGLPLFGHWKHLSHHMRPRAQWWRVHGVKYLATLTSQPF
jgi:hypothetical protein